MKINSKLLINIIFLSFLYSCNDTKGILTNGDTYSNKTDSINKKNNFDPTSGGAIDPKPLVQPQIIVENGKTNLIFGNGSNNITLHLTLKPPVDTQKVTNLTGLKYIMGEFYIGNLKIPVQIDSEKITSDLDYTFEIKGLENNIQLTLNTNVIDKNDQLMGSNEFKSTITEKVSFYQINVEITKWW